MYLRIIILLLLPLVQINAQGDLHSFEIRFDINKAYKLSMQKGVPLVLDFKLSNPEATIIHQAKLAFEEELTTLPDSTRRKLDSISLGIPIEYDKESWGRATVFELVLINGKNIPKDYTLYTLTPVPEDKLSLDGETTLNFSFGIDPEDMLNFPSGKYYAKIGLTDLIINGIGNDTIWSNTVKFQITEPQIDIFKVTDEAERYFIIDYLLLRNRCLDARKVFESIKPTGFDAVNELIMKGELEECSGNLREALSIYQSAANMYERQGHYEPPEWIMYKIHILRERIMIEKH